MHTGGGIGDVLLSAPVIDCLSDANFQVDLLARSGTAMALATHPKIHERLTIDDKDPLTLADMRRWAALLKVRNYEVALLLWSTSRWAWTLAWSGIPVRVGQDSRLLYSWLFTDRVRVRSEHGDVDSHWTQILLDYPRKLGLENSSPKVVFPLTSVAKAKAEELISGFDFGDLDGPLLGFHCGKGLPLGPERWPIQHFQKIATDLQTNLRARLILTGGPQEVEIVRLLGRGLDKPFLDLAGRTNLPELAAIAERCLVFVCPDSGPMHLAAAVGTPVVGIFALDEDYPKRWAPFGVPHMIVRPTRPACPPGCKKPTCQSFSCYLKVTPDEVTLAVRELLDRNTANRHGTG